MAARSISPPRACYGRICASPRCPGQISPAPIFAGADLTDARLDGANLVNADLSNAALARTDLTGAKLTGARLDGANLLEARNLTQRQLDDAMGDAMTELPPHLTRPAFWIEDEVDPALDFANGIESPHLPRAVSRGKGGTMSWLVGGAPLAPEAQKLK